MEHCRCGADRSNDTSFKNESSQCSFIWYNTSERVKNPFYTMRCTLGEDKTFKLFEATDEKLWAHEIPFEN